MSALRGRVAAVVLLGLAFVLFSVLVASGWLNSYDREVAGAFSKLWLPGLQVLPHGFAVLGGLEVTTILMLGLAVYLRRVGMVQESWVVLAFPVAVVLELVYKRLVHHPEPPATLGHGDGPSFATLFEKSSALSNSFPSGHASRTILVYGLLAFVVSRLARHRALRLVAIPVAAILVVLMAFDRLYLEVHWESDVIGGLLLGATCLAGAILWLDAPKREV
jgi:membrane-associated phospholipid phosphatase